VSIGIALGVYLGVRGIPGAGEAAVDQSLLLLMRWQVGGGGGGGNELVFDATDLTFDATALTFS
jgi:hypothetical protein